MSSFGESSEDSASDDKDLIFLVKPGEQNLNSEESGSDWTPVVLLPPKVNKKRALYEEGLYAPGSGDICSKYIPASDSTILRHVYYNYPSVNDPGIKEALLASIKPIIYPDDGQELYLQLCSEMKLCPVRLFHKNLMNREINLSYYCVDPKGVNAMAAALQYNNLVTKFDLTENFLNDDACYHLGVMLGTNTTLRELVLTGCRIGASGLLRLGENLSLKNNTLMSLNLSRNNLGDKGGVCFANMLSDGAQITNVNLSKNQLSRETALALAEVMEWRDNIIQIDLSWNSFRDVPATVKFLKQMANSKLLQEINLSYNSLDGERVAAAIYNLLCIPTLQILDLSHNRFRDEAITTMIAGLIKAKLLKIFNLSYNPMTPEDAYQTLFKMLRPRVKLQNLLMDSVSVDKSFLDLLARVSKMKSRKNFTVTYGDVLHNWTVDGPDPRELLLKRANYIGMSTPRHKIDIPLYFLRLNEELVQPISPKALIERLDNDKIHLSEAFVNELANIFRGPKTKKSNTINLNAISEYIDRLWPEKRLLLIPEPVIEPEPTPEVIAPPPPKKAKSKGKKK